MPVCSMTVLKHCLSARRYEEEMYFNTVSQYAVMQYDCP